MLLPKVDGPAEEAQEGFFLLLKKEIRRGNKLGFQVFMQCYVVTFGVEVSGL